MGARGQSGAERGGWGCRRGSGASWIQRVWGPRRVRVWSRLESPLAAVEAVKEAGGRPGVMGWVADFREF